MKSLAASLIAITTVLTFSSCETVVVEPPTRSVTTTEETTIHRPSATTTETEIRRY